MLQADGKIVIVGSDVSTNRFFIVRLLANGTVDSTFQATGPQWFGSTTVAQAFAVAVGPGGTIVVAGRSGPNLALARYTSSGTLDNTTFNGSGLLIHAFGLQSEADAVVVQPDGKIIVAGSELAANGNLVNLVARFTSTGTLDTTFGTGGRALTTSSPLQDAAAHHPAGHEADRRRLRQRRHRRHLALQRERHDRHHVRHGRDHPHAHRRSVDPDHRPHHRRVGPPRRQRRRHVQRRGCSFTAAFRYSADGIPDPTFGCSGLVLTEALGNGAGVIYGSAAATSVAVAGNDILVGSAVTQSDGTASPPSDNMVTRYHGSGAHTSGYSLLRGDGGTSAFGGAAACGSVAGLQLTKPMVGMASVPTGAGNWTVASDGGVFSFGAARFFGSTGAIHLNKPIVGMAAAPDGKGYWLVASDGGVFSFGSAKFFGSTGAIHLNKPIVGMAAAPDGKGYWLVASDGGVFSYGSAKFAGSTGAIHLNKPVVGMAADRDGTGYWLVASDGGVFAFSAKFSGSTGAIKLNQPIVGMAADPDGTGYWIAARDGGVFAFAATFNGSTGATPFPVGSVRSTIGIAATP